MNVFELADYEVNKADVEKTRQAKAAAELGYESTDDLKPNVFQKAAAELARESKTPDMPGKLPSNLNAMRRRLGMQQTAVDGEGGEGFAKKAYDFMGQRSGLGATAGGILGAALGPQTGGLSILIPALAAAGGGAVGAATEGKNPLKEGLIEGASQGVFGGAAKLAKPAWQFAKNTAVQTFGGRAGVSEAAEGLMKRWFSPRVSAEFLYNQAARSGAVVPLAETANVVDNLLQSEVHRMPLEVQGELKGALEPILDFIRPQGKYLVAQPVADSMADVRRLGRLAKQAFSGKTPNADLGNAYNAVRAAILDDLERVGVPEVRAASKAYRRKMAIESLSEQIARPIPGVKLREAYRKNKLFEKSFSAPEKEQIDRIVKQLERVTPSGLSGAIGKIATTGVGAVLGTPFGPVGHAIGSVGGYVGAEYLRELLASPAGRNFMEKTLEDSYKLGSGKVVQSVGPVLAIFARGLMSGEHETEQ